MNYWLKMNEPGNNDAFEERILLNVKDNNLTVKIDIRVVGYWIIAGLIIYGVSEVLTSQSFHLNISKDVEERICERSLREPSNKKWSCRMYMA